MTITREHGNVVFMCDGCHDPLNTNEKDFDEAHMEMKAHGWWTTKNGETWEHYCNSCWEVRKRRKT